MTYAERREDTRHFCQNGLIGYHSISFPLISAGIFGGSLEHPAMESTKQCCRAYMKFSDDYPEYDIQVVLCAFSPSEMREAEEEFAKYSL